jgi:uracil-DNA glycosylase family 4
LPSGVRTFLDPLRKENRDRPGSWQPAYPPVSRVATTICCSPILALASILPDTHPVANTVPIIAYLRQMARQGASHVMLDEKARKILRSFYRRPQAPSRPNAERPAPAAAVVSAHAPIIPTDSSSPEPPGTVPVPVPSGATVEDQLDSLRAQAAKWEPCLQLGTLRDTMVFSTGNPRADLMLVGEAPGHNEELEGKPFVGKAGQKLTQILKAMGLQREDVYISNICKFRPAMARNQGTANRKPTREEMDACIPFVRAEISLVRPKCIVALGATAAEGLLHSELGVGKLRGSWHEFDGIPVRVTYHPSYLLHNEHASGEKRKVWDDMLTVMEQLGMPITEQQRGFFQ